MTLASLITAGASSASLPALPGDIHDPNSSSYAYLVSLTSQTLTDLRGQPGALSTARSSLNTQLSSLCSQHVSSFVQVHQATSSLPFILDKLDTVLGKIIDRDLPALAQAAQQVPEQIQSPLQAKERAQTLISQHDLYLKDLIDIPRLMVTCVRANHPVEALLLAIQMMKIESNSKHSSVICSLKKECLIHLKRLQQDLLRNLGTRGLRLPAAKRVVSLLRKFREVDESGDGALMGLETVMSIEKLALSESAICLSLLQSRWIWLEELSSGPAATRSGTHLSSTLSTWRDTVGDTCSLAQTLFARNEQTEDDELAPSTLISHFSHQALGILRQLLAESLPSLQEDSLSLQDEFETLAAMHTQLAYAAASLSRQGLDISRAAFGNEVFEKQVLTSFKKAMRKARENFESGRQGKADNDCLSWLGAMGVQEVLDRNLSSFADPEDWATCIRQFPRLVIFVNGVLEGFNALLTFAPASSGAEIRKMLASNLLQIIEPLFTSFQTVHQATPSLSLTPVLSNSSQATYYERDSTRQMEANLAVLARILATLCGPVTRYLDGLIADLFGLTKEIADPLAKVTTDAIAWCEMAEEGWKGGERAREDSVRQKEERIAAEEARQKADEDARQVELRRMAAEEAEKQRLLDIARVREAEEESRRLAEAAEEDRRRAGNEQQQLRQEAQSKARKDAESEVAQRRQQAETEAEAEDKAERERAHKKAEEDKQARAEQTGAVEDERTEELSKNGLATNQKEEKDTGAQEDVPRSETEHVKAQ